MLDTDQWVLQQFGECELGRQHRAFEESGWRMLASPGLRQRCAVCGHPIVLHPTLRKLFRTRQQTRQTKPGRYLLICDTTDIDHYSHKSTTGLGILGDGRGRGMQFHNCLMYDSGKKQIVGAAGALIHYRKQTPKGETRAQRLSRVPPPRGLFVLGRGAPRPPERCVLAIGRTSPAYQLHR